MNRDNLEKEESIRDLQLDIQKQKVEASNMQAQIEKLKKRKTFLCC